MTPNRLRSILVDRGITVRQLAKELDVCPGTVSGVINRHHTSKRTKQYIAERLGLPYEKIWGKAA